MARSTLIRNRKQFLRTSAEGGGGGNGGENTGGNDGGGSTGGEKLFTQAELDAKIGERLNRQKGQFESKYADYDELKDKATKYDTLLQESESDKDKAVREAREQAAAEERSKAAPQLVGAEFRAAAKGVLTDDQLKALTEDLDMTKYLDDKGAVDVAKVTAKVTALAPPVDEKQRRRVPDLGQGNRQTSGKPSVASAREDYLEKRRPKR